MYVSQVQLYNPGSNWIVELKILMQSQIANHGEDEFDW